MGTYSEVSPSGRGLRIVCHGRKPDRERCRQGKVEMYDGATRDGKPGGRFLTITGQRLDGVPQHVRRRPKALARVYLREVNPPAALPAQTPPSATSRPSALSDDQIISKAKAARNGAKFKALWDGDASGYQSRSEADLSLCRLLAFWTGPDPVRIDALFRQSRLVRAKWEERAQYRQDTIAKALQGVTTFYVPEETRKQADRAGQGITERLTEHYRASTYTGGGTLCNAL
jgi:primase-polymerase (primpol)-like protein